MKLHQAFVCKFSRKKVLLWPPPQMRNTCLCSYLVMILSSIHVWFLLISLAKVGAVSFACKSAASAGDLALMSRLAHGALDWAQQSSQHTLEIQICESVSRFLDVWDCPIILVLVSNKIKGMRLNVMQHKVASCRPHSAMKRPAGWMLWGEEETPWPGLAHWWFWNHSWCLTTK